MAQPKLKVLISGGGIAGPCLAYWLARTKLSISITIIERSPIPRPTGQAIDIHEPGIEVVQKMGLLDMVRDHTTTEIGTTFRQPNGSPTSLLIKDGLSLTQEYEILRADLCRILTDSSKKFTNVRYVYGDCIKSLTQDEKGAHVQLASGSNDTYDLVVAADGSMSRTRSMIIDDAECERNFLGQYNAFFSIPRQPHDDKMWQFYSAPKGRTVMIRPHRNETTMGSYLSVTTPARGQVDPALEAAMEKGNEEVKKVLHQYFDDAGWEAKRVLAGMDEAPDFYISRALRVKTARWTNGRAALLGDAADATFGIGTTLAIAGAYYMAGELSKIQSSSDIPQALKTYEKVFRKVGEKMGDLPSFYPQGIFPQSMFGVAVRNWIFWVLAKTGLARFMLGGENPGAKAQLPEYDWIDV